MASQVGDVVHWPPVSLDGSMSVAINFSQNKIYFSKTLTK